MPQAETTRNRLLAVIAVVLAVAALRATYAVTMPIALSALVIAAIWPLKRWLDRFLPQPLSYAAVIAALLLVLGGFVAAAYFSAAQVVQVFTHDWSRVENAWRPVEQGLAHLGIALNAEQGHRQILGFGRYILSTAYSTLVYLGFIIILVIFGLPQVPKLRNKLRAELAARERRETMEAVEAIAGKIRRYLATTTATSILTGVLSAIWALVTGLDFVLLWGVLNFLLNYIPLVGNAAGTLLPALYALIQFPNLSMPALVFAGFAAIQIGVSNFLYPMLQGRSLSLSSLGVIVALAVWTWIWGIPGTFLAIPLTVAMVVACEHFPAARWIAVLLSSSSDDRPG